MSATPDFKQQLRRVLFQCVMTHARGSFDDALLGIPESAVNDADWKMGESGLDEYIYNVSDLCERFVETHQDYFGVPLFQAKEFALAVANYVSVFVERGFFESGRETDFAVASCCVSHICNFYPKAANQEEKTWEFYLPLVEAFAEEICNQSLSVNKTRLFAHVYKHYEESTLNRLAEFASLD